MTRDWSDERFVKLYTRDEPEWLVLPWWARGLMAELMKRVDSAGVMKLGKAGRKAIAPALSSQWDDQLATAVQMLVDDGAIELVEDETSLIIPNFVEAQEARQTDRARQQKRRERLRTMSQNVTGSSRNVLCPPSSGGDRMSSGHDEDRSRSSRVVTHRDATVTNRDDASRNVTKTSRAVTNRREEKRREYPPLKPPPLDGQLLPPEAALVSVCGERPRAAPLRFLPDDWSPTAEHLATAHELGMSEDQMVAEAKRFVSDARAKGKTFTDPDHGFHAWLRSPYREVEKQAKRANGKRAPPPIQPTSDAWRRSTPADLEEICKSTTTKPKAG